MTADNSPHESSASVFAEASEWLIDFREGCVDGDGRTRFNAWLRRSPEHIQAYMEAAALWGDIPALAADMDVDVEAVVAHARAQSNVTRLNTGTDAAVVHVDVAASSGRSSRRVPLIRRPWSLAAALAAVIVGAALVTWLQLGRGTLYATAIGEQRSIALADGSTIALGARSRVRVHFTDQEREVEFLAGEALFGVAKDPTRPFVVATSNTRVRAVGTQFDVHKRTSGTTVTVLEGRVVVYSPSDRSDSLPQNPHSSAAPASLAGDANLPAAKLTHEGRAEGRATPRQTPKTRDTGAASLMGEESGQAEGTAAIFLAAGEQVTVPEAAGAGTAQPRAVDAAASTTWTERTLTFDNAPLLDVVEEFNRYNEKQIVLTDTALESLRISGVFAATKPVSLLRFLSEQMQLDVIATADQIKISAKSTKS
jgi:transmembrane sensor